MRQSLALLIALTFVTALAAATVAHAGPVNARALTAAEQAQVEAGEVILESQKYQDAEGKTRGRGLAIGYIKADKTKILNAILAYETYPQWMPRVKQTSVYKNTATEKDVKFSLKVLITVEYHIKHLIDAGAGEITWTLDASKPNDIKATTGFWKIVPYKQGCLVYYSVTLDTGKAVPAAVEDYLTKKDLPNIIKTLRTRVGG